MRMYIRQIDDDIIREVLSPQEYLHYKSIAKSWVDISDEKQELENTLCKKLTSRVVGTLEGVTLRYLHHGDTFYVRYETYHKPPWWRFW